MWRLRYDEGDGWFYIYLLIELQSSVDPFMALRLLVYLGLLYQHLLKNGELGPTGKLPPALPLVLYNGEARWTAPTQMADLVDGSIPELANYRPRFAYRVIDEVHLARHTLDTIEGPVAAVFRVEQSRTPDDMRRQLERLIRELDRWNLVELRRAVGAWFRHILGFRLGHESIFIDELRELTTMLEERIRQWEAQMQAEARAEGLAEGEARGMASVFLKQYRLKFTQEPDTVVRERVRDASVDELTRWLELILVASEPAELFED